MDNIILMGINVIEKVINSKVQNFGDPCSWYISNGAGRRSNVKCFFGDTISNCLRSTFKILTDKFTQTDS